METELSKTLLAYLDGDMRMAIGPITLKAADPIEKFAQAAYRQAQGSLKRLMQPKWRVVIVDERGQEHGFGLDKWNKLVDGREEETRRIDAFKRAQAQNIYSGNSRKTLADKPISGKHVRK